MIEKQETTGWPLVIETFTPADPAGLIQEAEKARRFVERLVGVES